jgi:uncharacterized membrane protein
MNKKYLANKIYEYDEVLEIITDDLKNVNIKSFCVTHELNYNTVWQAITKYQNKMYPNLISKILGILGYNATSVTAFKFLGVKPDTK